MTTLEKAAREYAGIKPDVFIDSEERYYNSCACENYDAFKAGAKWMQNTMIEKATQWLFENVYDYLNPEDQERVESFRKYLEE